MEDQNIAMHFKNPEDYVKYKRALKTVTSFMEDSRRYTDTYFSIFDKLWSEYLISRRNTKSPLQRANLRLPYAFTIVETIVPMLVEAFMSEDSYIGVKSRKPEAVVFEESLADFLTYQLQQADFYQKCTAFFKEFSIFGTAIAKVPWKYDERIVNKKSRQFTPDFQLKQINEKFRQVTYDGPAFEPITIWDFFPDPTATNPGDIQSMRGCVHRTWKTLDELKKKKKVKQPDGSYKGIYENLELLEAEIKEKDESRKSNYSDPDTDSDHSTRDSSLNLKDGVKRIDKICVWEYWGKYDVTGRGDFEEYVIAVANETTVIRCTLNPYNEQFKPFVGAVNYAVPGEFYGIGDIEMVLSLIREATALRNVRLDQANLAVNRMYLVDRAANINVRNLYARPNGLILTNDVNGLKPLDVPEVPGSSYREQAQIDYDIQNTAALASTSNNASNLGKAFGRTATGVSFLQNYTASRISLKVRNLDHMLFRRLGQILLMLDDQFLRADGLGEDIWLRVTNNPNNPFTILPVDAFAQEYDFYPVGAVDKLNQKERQMNLQQNVVPYLQMIEQARPGMVKLDELTKQYLKEFDFKNPNLLVNTPEVQQQYSAQQQMQQQQQQHQAMMYQAQVQSVLKDKDIEKEVLKKDMDHENDMTRMVTEKILDAASNSESEEPNDEQFI